MTQANNSLHAGLASFISQIRAQVGLIGCSLFVWKGYIYTQSSFGFSGGGLI